MNVKKDNPVLAVHCFIRSLGLLGHPDLRRYLIVPVVVNLLLYSLAFILSYQYLSGWINDIIPGWLMWLEWLIWPLFFLCYLLATFFSFTLMANLIASPFYSKLALKTLQVISEQPPALTEPPIMQVLLSELKRIFYLVSRMLPLLLLFIIPGLNLIAPLLWALFGAWGMGLEYLAYPMENQGVLFSELRTQAKTTRLSVLTLGGLTLGGLSLPIINLIIAPAAVIAATLYQYEQQTELSDF